jgi:hypothetical protein
MTSHNMGTTLKSYKLVQFVTSYVNPVTSDPCISPSKQNRSYPEVATYSIPLVLREASKARSLYMYHTDHSYMRQIQMNVLHRAIIITSLKYNSYAW